ncbi:MAG: hypothetical protein GY841_06680 [FCB group bacterium]|nr:hypothetical protein [FCB group bacterium]
MRKQAFLLGLFSIGGQVFLLRELVATFHGDELFIGTALFGWLVAVAIGAVLAGRLKYPIDLRLLFALGAVLLPMMIIAVRLIPFWATDIVGEVIPFTQASMISILAMLPIGIISGMIFTFVSDKGGRAAESIAIVYLFEGLGAFIGGLAVTFATGGPVSSLVAAAMLGVLISASVYLENSIRRQVIVGVAMVAAAVLIIAAFPALERRIDRAVYEPYNIIESFDSHYGRHAILERGAEKVFLTNQVIEAIYPDVETNENLLVPVWIYNPDIKLVLYIGRAEFGIAELAVGMGLQLTTIDPRSELNERLSRWFSSPASTNHIDEDPVKYFSSYGIDRLYDLIIIDASELDSYLDSRYFTEEFLTSAGRWLNEDGILYIPTAYDSDRHLNADKRRALSVIHNTLKQVYPKVGYWPGGRTLFFASLRHDFDLPTDSIMARVERLALSPQYIHPNYLIDRLEQMKMERLRAAVGEYDEINSLTRPMLPHIQAMMNSRLDSFDRRLIGFVLGQSWWILFLPFMILIVFAVCLVRLGKGERYSLFLYFVAGLVSLSLELICFYLYQSTAGSLYSEMAVLIGVFMLGLSLGTYYALKVGDRPVEFPALVMLVTTVMIFIFSYESVVGDVLLLYYSLFLLVTALATGTLFVGATNRYYNVRIRANRGVGYGWELIGSSIGALLTTTVLLPVIGLHWLLWSLVILLAVTFAGAVITANS